MEAALQAVVHGRLTELQRIVESGALANVDTPDCHFCTLLHWAAVNGQADLCLYLASRRANLNVSGGALNETPLQWAARMSRVRVVETLVGLNADIHHRNLEGRDAFFLSVMADNQPSLLLLASKGAEVNHPDSQGCTPLLWTLSNHSRNLRLVRTLLSLGADITAVDDLGNGAVHLAVLYSATEEDAAEVIRTLRGRSRMLQMGRNMEGRDPEQLAMERGWDRLAKHLRKVKALQCTPPVFFVAWPFVMLAVLCVCADCGGVLGSLAAWAVVFFLNRRYIRALSPAQDDCLARGFIVSFVCALMLCYMIDMRTDWRAVGFRGVDFALWILTPMTTGLMARLRFTSPNTGKRIRRPPSALHTLKRYFSTRCETPSPCSTACVMPTGAGVIASEDGVADMHGEDEAAFQECHQLCPTCFVPRKDERTYHCVRCERCVALHDHHCAFMGICIGRRNRWTFLLLLFVSIAALGLWLGTTARHVVLLASTHALDKLLGSEGHIVVLSVMATIMWFRVVALLTLQLFTSRSHHTTPELLRRRNSSMNVYEAVKPSAVAKGVVRSVLWLPSKMTRSKISGRSGADDCVLPQNQVTPPNSMSKLPWAKPRAFSIFKRTFSPGRATNSSAESMV